MDQGDHRLRGSLPPYPVGHEFYGPFVANTLTDGWAYGAITQFLRPDLPEGCDSGDGFVVAPDGSYCGLVWWRDCPWACQCIGMRTRAGFFGIYEVRFPIIVRSITDLVANFRLILPELQNRYGLWARGDRPDFDYVPDPDDPDWDVWNDVEG